MISLCITTFWASLIAQLVKHQPAMQEIPFSSWMGKIPWRRGRLPTPVFLDFPCGSAGKESTCNAEDLGLIPGLGRSPGGGKGYPLQYSGLENFMDCSLSGSSVHWDSPGKNTGVGCHALLQGIFPTQGSNQGLLHCRWIFYHLSGQKSP